MKKKINKLKYRYENMCWWWQPSCLHWSAVHWARVSQLSPKASLFSSIKMWILNLPAGFTLVKSSKGVLKVSACFLPVCLLCGAGDGTQGLSLLGRCWAGEARRQSLEPLDCLLNTWTSLPPIPEPSSFSGKPKMYLPLLLCEIKIKPEILFSKSTEGLAWSSKAQFQHCWQNRVGLLAAKRRQRTRMFPRKETREGHQSGPPNREAPCEHTSCFYISLNLGYSENWREAGPPSNTIRGVSTKEVRWDQGGTTLRKLVFAFSALV